MFLLAMILSVSPAWSADSVTKATPVTKTKKAQATTAKSASKNTKDVGTLDAIRIEGEIDVPQVLFITARDYRRFRDGTPKQYQTTSADIAKTIPLPNRVRMVAPVE